MCGWQWAGHNGYYCYESGHYHSDNVSENNHRSWPQWTSLQRSGEWAVITMITSHRALSQWSGDGRVPVWSLIYRPQNQKNEDACGQDVALWKDEKGGRSVEWKSGERRPDPGHCLWPRRISWNDETCPAYQSLYKSLVRCTSLDCHSRNQVSHLTINNKPIIRAVTQTSMQLLHTPAQTPPSLGQVSTGREPKKIKVWELVFFKKKTVSR